MSDYGQQKTTWRGHRFNRRSVAALNEVERRLGYELHISQGSYNTSVSASANTHAGGGAVDCVGRGDWAHEVRVMREVGWVAWHRTRPTFSSEHIHAILRGDPDMHEQARDQVRECEINGDGLVGSSPDTGPRIEIPVSRCGSSRHRPVSRPPDSYQASTWRAPRLRSYAAWRGLPHGQSSGSSVH